MLIQRHWVHKLNVVLDRDVTLDLLHRARAELEYSLLGDEQVEDVEREVPPNLKLVIVKLLLEIGRHASPCDLFLLLFHRSFNVFVLTLVGSVSKHEASFFRASHFFEVPVVKIEVNLILIDLFGCHDHYLLLRQVSLYDGLNRLCSGHLLSLCLFFLFQGHEFLIGHGPCIQVCLGRADIVPHFGSLRSLNFCSIGGGNRLLYGFYFSSSSDCNLLLFVTTQIPT